MVVGDGEDTGDEGLPHLADFSAEEFQELPVPYSPCAVEILHPSETAVGHIFILAVIFLHAGLPGKALIPRLSLSAPEKPGR